MSSFESDLPFSYPTTPAKPDPETEDVKGITNVTGKVKGNANGLINLGVAAPTGARISGTQPPSSLIERAQAIEILAQAVPKLDGNSNGSDGGNVAPGTTKVRGLANVTGDVEGSANGGVNLGELNWGDTPAGDDPVKKQAPQKKK